MGGLELLMLLVGEVRPLEIEKDRKSKAVGDRSKAVGDRKEFAIIANRIY